MKEKSEASTIFKTFHTMIKTQFQTTIQILITDNGREYFSLILGDYLLFAGIVHHSSYVDTLQQNGVLEQKNRHLLKVTHALIFQINVPKQFWRSCIDDLLPYQLTANPCP